MNVKIQSVKFKADQKLEDLITAKVSKVAALYSNTVGAEVTLKLVRDEDRENKVVDIRLEIPGNDLFASKHSSTFEESTAEACDAIRMQIEKIKTKYQK